MITIILLSICWGVACWAAYHMGVAEGRNQELRRHLRENKRVDKDPL